MRNQTEPFTLQHYLLLKPLQKKWEVYKSLKSVTILQSEQKFISPVVKAISGFDADWGCGACIANNFSIVMRAYDAFCDTYVPEPIGPLGESRGDDLKVAIIVQSSTHAPYDAFMKAQKETWANVSCKNVTVQFYTAEMYGIPATYDMQHWKTKHAIDYFFHGNIEFDFIFNTHSSSYINKKLLIEQAKKLPLKGCFAGSSGLSHPTTLETKNFVSGSGHFWSRDVADKVRNIFTKEPCIPSDVMLSRKLQEAGVIINPMLKRLDYNVHNTPKDAEGHYHIRFNNKPTVGDRVQDISERNLDIQRMREVHKHLMKIKTAQFV